MNKKFSLLLPCLLLPIGYLGVKSTLEVRERKNLDELPFSINDSIRIATQNGRLKNRKLFLVYEKNNLLRLVYKARFSESLQTLKSQLKQDLIVEDQIAFDATLLFSNQTSNAYQSSAINLNRRLTLQNEKSLATIFTEPLRGDERDSIIRFLQSKTYTHISFMGLETGTYFRVDHEHFNRHMPIFLEKCMDEDITSTHVSYCGKFSMTKMIYDYARIS